MRRAILGALTMGGCGYDNPGFKLKDSETGSVEATTQVTGVTVTSEQTTIVPTTTTTTTDDTSSGPQVSGSETSTSTTEGLTSTTSETSSTTELPMVEWPDCKLGEALPGPTSLALADTFLLNTTAGGICYGSPGACRDQDLSGMDYFEVYFQDGKNTDQDDDFASVFVARFATPPDPLHEGLVVPESSRVGVRVTIHVARPPQPETWAPTTFNVFPVTGGKSWMETKKKILTSCVFPGVSFRCRECGEAVGVCKDKEGEWPDKYAYAAPLPNPLPGGTWTQDPEPKAGTGEDISFDLSIEALSWLTKAGMALIVGNDVGEGMIGVTTKEFAGGASGPFIQYLYCPPVYL